MNYNRIDLIWVEFFNTDLSKIVKFLVFLEVDGFLLNEYKVIWKLLKIFKNLKRLRKSLIVSFGGKPTLRVEIGFSNV
jgi:uncharacterized protein YjhX (UPF0386 family)